MRRLKHYLLQIVIALDQLANTLLGGWADETMSSYAHRLHQVRKPWGITRGVINRIFFFQEDHCRASYESERNRAQLPPEFREP